MGFNRNIRFLNGKKCSFVWSSFLSLWRPFVTFNFKTFFLSLELPTKYYKTCVLSKMSQFTTSESNYNITTDSISLHMNILFLGHVIPTYYHSYIVFHYFQYTLHWRNSFTSLQICNRCIFWKNVALSTLSLLPLFLQMRFSVCFFGLSFPIAYPQISQERCSCRVFYSLELCFKNTFSV